MILILCPLGRELKSLKHHCERLGFKFEEKTLGPLKCWESESFVLGFGGHGKTQFAVHTEFLRHQWEVTHIFCVGAGGALGPDIKVLDVIVGTEIIEHDYKEKFDSQGELPRFKCDEDAVKIFKKYEGPFTVHCGPIASGDEDIVSTKRAQELHAHTQALAVAWEGAGGARVAQFHRLPYTEIRAVTDAAGEKAVEEFHASLDEAMARIAAVLYFFFSEKK